MSGKGVDALKGFSSKKEIEPEDNFEQDELSSISDDYETELDTDELKGNSFMSNNSLEEQRGSITTHIGGTKKSKTSGGIQCLRNFRNLRIHTSKKKKTNLRRKKKKIGPK